MDRMKSLVWLPAAVLAVLAPSSALAHGWHNAALTTSSLDDWLADVKRAVPDVLQRLNATEMTAGEGLEALRKRNQAAGRQSGVIGGARRPLDRSRKIDSQLTVQQQALLGRKADDCLEALAFMLPENIVPEEFPNFPMEKINLYRDTASKLLRLMGRPGVSSVVGELRAALMGAGRQADDTSFTLRRDYYDELLRILKDAGDRGLLSSEDEQSLREAAAGQKTPALDTLARNVLDTLDELAVNTRKLPELVPLLAQLNNVNEERALVARIRGRLPEAPLSDLLELLQADPPRALRQLTIIELEKRFPQASVLELLQAQAAATDPAVIRRAAAILDARSPKFAEVRDDLAAIAKFARDDASPLAEPARRQLANAFQRAPIRECLVWLGKSDEALQKLIWQQIDGRIARADGARRKLYRDVALESLGDQKAATGQQRAACELLGRLDPPLVVASLVDALPRLPREVWPTAGEVLRNLTRQDFGPRPGDGAGELVGQEKQWRQWLKEHPEFDEP